MTRVSSSACKIDQVYFTDWMSFLPSNLMEEINPTSDINSLINTAWKVSVFGVFLVRFFPHSDWIWRDTPYLNYVANYVANLR